MTSALPSRLPDGVDVRALTLRADERGTLVECFREAWPSVTRPVQWNVVRSEPRVLRGFHAHARHFDYLFMAAGRMDLGLRDIRASSPTFGLAARIEISAESPTAVTLPPGVAHGFCFLERSIHVYAVSEYWDQNDELGCHWGDPAIGIDWPISDPTLSPRDRDAGTLAEMIRLYEARRVEAALGPLGEGR